MVHKIIMKKSTGKLSWKHPQSKHYDQTKWLILDYNWSTDAAIINEIHKYTWNGSNFVKSKAWLNHKKRENTRLLLTKTEFYYNRHIEEKEKVLVTLQVSTTLTDEQWKELLKYREDLRKVIDDPSKGLPIKPDFIK